MKTNWKFKGVINALNYKYKVGSKVFYENLKGWMIHQKATNTNNACICAFGNFKHWEGF